METVSETTPALRLLDFYLYDEFDAAVMERHHANVLCTALGCRHTYSVVRAEQHGPRPMLHITEQFEKI